MKKTMLLLLSLWQAFSLSAQTGTEWQDLQVNEVNRYPVHTSFFGYENAEKALKGDKTLSDRYLTLHGTWKFNWVENADQRPTDFYKTDLDDSKWGTMPVPGMWELNGYGDPLYVNIGYAWRGHYQNNPPVPPTKDNHVGSYRRTITVPAEWKGEQIIAHFGSVTSNMYLYINGQFVGYTEDSKLAAEFDITDFVHPGDNLFAFQTFRWCDGSYCEDQDFWRLCGVARDSYLYTQPKAAKLKDIRLTTDLANNYKDGVLTIDVKTEGKVQIDYTLLDAQGNEVKGTKAQNTITVPDAKAWTAETPYLYTLVTKVYAVEKGKRGKLLSVVPQKVGFRKVEIKGSRFLVNGQPIYIKGADRHEMDPDGGYVVSRERMIEDIKIMKSLNLNAVRTCHYMDDPQWYDLCDEYGIYLCAEANQESHGLGYELTSIARTPLFLQQIMERNQHNVGVNFNHPSIITWSMGNETVDGPNFTEAMAWIKTQDMSRPVQWERTLKGPNTDIYVPMYASQEYCQTYADSDKPEDQRPLIQCEYNHTMGNSSGGFKEYWDIVRQNKKFQGGFIWDFVDQALWGTTKNPGGDEVKTLMYGGCYNDYDPSDNNFNCNGFITADRKLTPLAYEIGFQYQSIWTELLDKEKGTISVKNEYFFRDLKNVRLHWELVDGGMVVGEGRVEDIDVAPQQKRVINLNYGKKDARVELVLRLHYELKDAEPLMEAGQEIAHQQFVLAEFDYAKSKTGVMAVAKADTKVSFNKETGLLESLNVNGEEMLIGGATLRPNFWRAVTDNDMGAGLVQKMKVWRNPVMNLTSLNTEGNVTTAVYDMPEVQAVLTLTYTLADNGVLTVNQKMKTTEGAKVPEMFCFGMIMQLPYRYDMSTFYGLGPIENYCDRCSGQMLGLYTQSADDQFWKYVRPQETGTKTGIRTWFQSVDQEKYGAEDKVASLMFLSDGPFCASALHYDINDLDEGDEKGQRHPEEVRKSEYTNLMINLEMAGLGGTNSWDPTAEALPQYQIKYKDREFNFSIVPLMK